MDTRCHSSIGVFAGAGPSGVSTDKSLYAGRYRLTGSFSDTFPCSTSVINAVMVWTFVMENIR